MQINDDRQDDYVRAADYLNAGIRGRFAAA